MFWKKHLFSGRRPGDEKPEAPIAEQPGSAVDEPDDGAELDTLLAAKEARQRIHVSETTNWRYTSGLW
jgi:hypothetical protein